jgi:hypothetical protein
MNIHVCYSVFDNEELLEHSINSIRNSVEEITVLFQNISNHGLKASDELQDFLLSLKNKKIIDNLILFNPNLSISAPLNELRKNQISYELSKNKKMDYHMLLACDEFYFEKDMLYFKNLLKEMPVDILTSYMYTYYKSSKYKFKQLDNYVVPVFHKVYQDDRNFSVNASVPLTIDPMRKMNYDSCICLPKETPYMHHLSFVRKDFRKKLENSSAKSSFVNDIDKMVENYLNWKPIEKAYLFGEYKELEYSDTFKEEIIF